MTLLRIILECHLPNVVTVELFCDYDSRKLLRFNAINVDMCDSLVYYWTNITIALPYQPNALRLIKKAVYAKYSHPYMDWLFIGR